MANKLEQLSLELADLSRQYSDKYNRFQQLLAKLRKENAVHKSIITQHDINRLINKGQISFNDGNCEIKLNYDSFEANKP